MKRIREYCLIAAVLVILLMGCTAEEGERSEVEFSVVAANETPDELLEIIEANKGAEIRMTWVDGDTMYLIRGYGEQATGGYSIAVAECTEDEETVWFDTRLIGPKNTENLSREPSYPYLVIKIEARAKAVMIQ